MFAYKVCTMRAIFKNVSVIKKDVGLNKSTNKLNFILYFCYLMNKTVNPLVDGV